MQRAVLVVVVLVLAGCQAPAAPLTETDAPDAGVERANGTETRTATTPTSTAANATPTAGDVPDDPATDRLGWEDGYWHNETLAVTPADGLNESELDAVVSRAMARVEVVRGLEFEERVSVEVINRSAFRGQSGGSYGDALRRFDNAKFEALFLVGERNDSIATQESTRGQSVLGFYSPSRDAIVVVSDSPTPRLDGEETLAHELVHALQDQHFDLGRERARTRDAVQGENGLVEGDATFTHRRYQARCGDQWQCLPRDRSDNGAGAAAPGHFGIQFLEYFPYSDGPGFVESLHEAGGWDRVDDAYDEYPDGSPEVVYPDRYSEWEPDPPEVRDRSSDEWERVSPPGRPDYAVPGQSAIAAGLAYTLADDYNRSAVVRPAAVINYRSDGSVNLADPYNYDVPGAAGWAGGRLYAYANGEESAYVWKTRWETADRAEAFARTWSAVIRHWGGERTGESTGADHGEWVITDGPFADAFSVRVDGRTVTVVNAPDSAELSAVHDA